MVKKRKKSKKKSRIFPIVLGGAILLSAGGLTTAHYVFATSPTPLSPMNDPDPNFGIRNKVIEFFEANDAHEMIDIIKCESRFRQYDKDGLPLKNSAGSSAIGVSQIMASVHPDEKIIARYNKKYDTGLSIKDLDINTFEGNIGYALILYKMNGVRDWECSKKFRF